MYPSTYDALVKMCLPGRIFFGGDINFKSRVPKYGRRARKKPDPFARAPARAIRLPKLNRNSPVAQKPHKTFFPFPTLYFFLSSCSAHIAVTFSLPPHSCAACNYSDGFYLPNMDHFWSFHGCFPLTISFSVYFFFDCIAAPGSHFHIHFAQPCTNTHKPNSHRELATKHIPVTTLA